MQALRGTQDILPSEVPKWNYVEHTIRTLCAKYGYEEIRTPIFEGTELFLRGIGDTTDVVTKEMYTFTDRGGRSVTLRPENTASVVRAFLEHKLYGDGQVHKLFYMGSMFRYDRPQAGRYREFHQFGIEVLNAESSLADAEAIALACDLFHTLGLRDLDLRINSIGDETCRPVYRKKLIAYFENHKEHLCHNCLERLYKNPLRLLDCKEEECRRVAEHAPAMIDDLCEKCRTRFEAVKSYLNALGIPYTIDSRLVRGLDYYTNTAFEIQYSPLGAQSAICGGGRYDRLVSEMGGPPTPAIGFAVGLERLLLALSMQNLFPPQPSKPSVYIVAMEKESIPDALIIQQALRAKNILSYMDLQERSTKGQMKQADKAGVDYAVIIGHDERVKSEATVKNMKDGMQRSIPFRRVAEIIASEVEIGH